MISQRLRYSKSAQMQMMETIGVIFIFFVLVVFGIIFFFRFQQIQVERRAEEALASRAMEITLQTLFLPELQCSRGIAEPEDNCIDLGKLRAFSQVIQDHSNDYYFNLFSFSRISVTQTYPQGGLEWVIYDRVPTTLNDQGVEVESWTRKEPTYFVVALRDETLAATYSFGYLTVEVYS